MKIEYEFERSRIPSLKETYLYVVFDVLEHVYCRFVPP